MVSSFATWAVWTLVAPKMQRCYRKMKRKKFIKKWNGNLGMQWKYKWKKIQLEQKTPVENQSNKVTGFHHLPCTPRDGDAENRVFFPNGNPESRSLTHSSEQITYQENLKNHCMFPLSLLRWKVCLLVLDQNAPN